MKTNSSKSMITGT